MAIPSPDGLGWFPSALPVAGSSGLLVLVAALAALCMLQSAFVPSSKPQVSNEAATLAAAGAVLATPEAAHARLPEDACRGRWGDGRCQNMNMYRKNTCLNKSLYPISISIL
ncbi:unnamed protein product [Cladocopium goreaui]|uniref:Uncharacterized protein n=1 Tax=Cladocopium goreaui TaxID=2562237 RepID=A0A9P1CCR0_9DINO|nr:unnamed protein product [Cladocopium goreaui]